MYGTISRQKRFTCGRSLAADPNPVKFSGKLRPNRHSGREINREIREKREIRTKFSVFETKITEKSQTNASYSENGPQNGLKMPILANFRLRNGFRPFPIDTFRR